MAHVSCGRESPQSGEPGIARGASPQTPSERLWSDRTAEAMRWVVCFALVATVHAVVAVALMNRFAQTAEESGVDAPLVMLDLPESLAPSLAPPQDLPSGPVEQEQTEATPPPKDEEIKPPEAEVALPEPPKPEQDQPVEVKQAAAPQAARTPPPSVVRWQSQLAAHIEHFRRYPQAARSHGDEGTASVAFTIDREGRVLRSAIVQSSGSEALDKETLAMLARAQPMPRPPNQLTDGELTFVIPVRFKIR